MLVAIGKYILSIDLSKVQQAAPVGGFTTEKTAVCHMKDLIEGITIIGEHEEDVTDLAIPPHSSSHIASSSADGLVSYFNPGIFLSTNIPSLFYLRLGKQFSCLFRGRTNSCAGNLRTLDSL